MNAETSMAPPFMLRRLGSSDAASYRELRLEGLRSHPEAFGASWEYEARAWLGSPDASKRNGAW